ncbi:MAG: 4'-phosphopantetheinyl transferase [Desulfuromonas sp.]|nr:MAG: 4'-phosphopantetheinyl transferase [Desulfuromonas sp.]
MPHIVGLGVDLTHIPRFRKLLTEQKRGVLERIFTPGELDYAMPKKNPAPHLAARFAAKEAFLKALGTGLRDGLSWQDMDVRRDKLGKPSLHLSGKAAEMIASRDVIALHLSYSHDGDYATATVILERACDC